MAQPAVTLSVTFLRVSERTLVATAVRDDGVTVRIKGVGPVHPLPHDLAHWVVERELGLTHGFWASVAAGAVFGSMAVIAGRRRPHAEERSKAVIKANGPYISQAEAVAASFVRVIERRLDRDRRAGLAFLQDEQSAVRAGVLAVGRDAFVRVCAALRDAAARWRDLPIGGSFMDSWTVPGPVGLRTAARERRPARPLPVRRAV
jgi:hypothetical protein